MIKLCDRNSCTGCMSCYNSCNKHAISMTMDEEGFLYPEINQESCINCKKCIKSCPILQSSNDNDCNHIPKVLAIRSKELNILKNSSSGGVFSTLAKYILSKQGVIYGAAFNKNLQLKHIRITTLKDLKRIQGSKYLQSYIGDIYQKVKDDLTNSSRLVLFSGTPCQIAGLKQFLNNKRYPNLFLVDLICHGVPSQKLFNNYCKKISTSNIKDFKFRNTKDTQFVSQYKSNLFYHQIKYQYKDYYTRAYLKGYLHRLSCYNCKFSKIPRQGDISIGDFWSIIMNKVPFHDIYHFGISCLLINTSQGTKLYQATQNLFIAEEKSLEDAILNNHNIIHCDKLPKERDYIYNDFFKMNPKEISLKYNLLEKRPNIKQFIISFLRTIKRKLWNSL